MTIRIIFILLLSLSRVYAQYTPTSSAAVEKGDGKITGTLVDSTTNEIVEFATLSLYKINDLKKPIDGTLTDDKGKFVMKNVINGKFILKFTSIGFKDKLIKLEEITDKNRVINLGNVQIATTAKTLNEVTVTAQGAIIEEKVDRLIYNAEKDITSKGGDASDVLRKVPLLSVDLDGNVSLRGSSNIRVLINNKPSSIMAASVADALKQIPADQIKTVEVITSPSSKYDAEGSSGIINIILKKNNLEGYTLNTDIAAGNRGGNLGLNGSLRAGKFGMTVGGGSRFNVNPSITEFEQTTKTLQKNARIKQNGEADDQMLFGRYNLGADYDITKKKSLSGGARFGTRSFDRDQILDISTFRENDLLNSTTRNIVSNSPSFSYDYNIDFLHIIKPQKEFSLSTLYSRNTANTDFSNSIIPVNESSTLSNFNKNLNQEFTLQSDYQTPIKKNQVLEFGVKGIIRAVNSNFGYTIGGKLSNTAETPTGTLDYNQDIAATYLSYTYATKSKYTFKVGARYEYTYISAKQNGNQNLDIPEYQNLVPSINVSKTYGGKYTVKAGYNRRLQRPGLTQLNPNINRVNQNSIIYGNPLLKPETADNFETSLSASIKKIYINLSLFARVTENSISQNTFKSKKDSSITETTFQNIGSDIAYGANWSGNLSITSKWMLNGGLEAVYSFLSGTTEGVTGSSTIIKNQGWNLNGRLMSFITLKNGWQVQAFSFVRGGRVLLLGRQGGFGVYSLGMRKEFKNKKGSIGLSTQNFLKSNMKIRSNSESPLFLQNNVNYMYNRGISVNLSYKIGKLGPDAISKKRAKGVKNDDVKEGGGDSGGGQPSGGGGGRPSN